MSLSAKQAFKQRVRHWAMQLEVPITWLAVSPMRHKWASCSTAGRLHFSTDLLPLDQELWDLVIVHELLHLSIPNHGRLWRALMHAHLGDWEAAAARLQRAKSAGPPASTPPQTVSPAPSAETQPAKHERRAKGHRVDQARAAILSGTRTVQGSS